jgi:hypothetical protein
MDKERVMAKPIGPDGLPMETHHILGCKDGPTIEISRTAHVLWHQANADAFRNEGLPTGGFCGDPFTLKIKTPNG